MQTASRSVDRVFELLALFKRERRALTATEIRRLTRMPHSSTVVLLTHLRSLGFLQYDETLRGYFPSLELHRLCAWIADAPNESHPLAALVRAVHERTGETTSISRRAGLFSLPVYVHAAEHPDAVQVRAGITGGLLTLSVVGRALLSLLGDDEIREIVEYSNSWARVGGAGFPQDVDALLRTVRHVREQRYLYDCNLLLPDVGAVAFPLRTPWSDEPLALTVAARAARMERDGRRIVREAANEIARHLKGVTDRTITAATDSGARTRASSAARPRARRATAPSARRRPAVAP